MKISLNFLIEATRLFGAFSLAFATLEVTHSDFGLLWTVLYFALLFIMLLGFCFEPSDLGVQGG